MDIIKFLEGKKTLSLVLLGLLIIGANSFHWITIPQETIQQLLSGVILAAIAALRVAK